MVFRSYFFFNRQQRNGIIILLCCVIGLLAVRYFGGFQENDSLSLESDSVVVLQSKLDSLRNNSSEKQTRYPFNPNYLTDYSGAFWGMTNEEIDRLHAFREKDQWIRTAEEFQDVTQISDSLWLAMKPYFKFPEWVTSPPKKKTNLAATGSKQSSDRPYAEKIDLNQATAEQLQEVFGIGEVLGNRIIAHRDKTSGFAVDEQLYGVYGLDSSVVQRVLHRFTVKTPVEILKIDVNTATASDIATIPGISFEQAKAIWEFRTLRERLESVEELTKIEGMTPSKLMLIRLYLSAE